MENLFVPYDLALKLKEKGFDEPCFTWYEVHDLYKEHELNNFLLYRNHNRFVNDISAPLYQQVIDWLREKHEIEASITYFRKEFRKRQNIKKYSGYVNLTKFQKDEYDADEDWMESLKYEIELPSTDDYYEALNMTIEESLKHV